MPLKVIIFEGSIQPPIFIRRLMEGLAEKGHDVYLMHFGTNIKSPIKNLQYISLGSSKNNYLLIYQSLVRAFETDFLGVVKTVEKILEGNRKNLQKRNLKVILEKIQPDLIHVQWPALLDVLEEVLEEGKYPVILSQRGYQINVKPFVDYNYFQKLARIFPKLSGFHSVSKAISVRGDNIWNAQAKVDEVVYTGLDLQNIPFKKTFSRNKKLKIITIGRPHWKKGLHDLISAGRILQNNRINFEWTIIGGNGNEEILFLSHFYRLEEEVRIMGKLSQEKVYDLMSGCDLLVVSSVEEGIPNVLVEAMAMGIPVISTSCGGVEELIDSGVEGWVVRTRDPKALATQIITFNSLSDQAIDMVRKAARKKVEKQHSHKKMIDGMEDLYRKVMVIPEI